MPIFHSVLCKSRIQENMFAAFSTQEDRGRLVIGRKIILKLILSDSIWN
jgi:hypothetical protein